MPDMDGRMLATEIRKTQGFPLILLTSQGLDPDQKSETLFVAKLTKPIKPAALSTTLHRVLGGEGGVMRTKAVRDPAFDAQLEQSHPLRILLAEDSRVNQKVTLLTLEKLGYHAAVAANGLEVLDALSQHTYDLILMDVQMPEMDGLEATRKIRAVWPANRQPRIIALTANVLSGAEKEYRTAGMDGYISKPVRLEGLIDYLRETPSLPATPPGEEKTASSAGEGISGHIDLAQLETLYVMAGYDEGYIQELIDIFTTDATQMLGRSARQRREWTTRAHWSDWPTLSSPPVSWSAPCRWEHSARSWSPSPAAAPCLTPSTESHPSKKAITPSNKNCNND